MMCVYLGWPLFPEKKNDCLVRRMEPSVECVKAIVYRIRFSCGSWHIRQMSRCINERLLEQKRNVKKLAMQLEGVRHLDACPHCSVQWDAITAIHKEKNDDRRLCKATLRTPASKNSVSNSSLFFYTCTLRFLGFYDHHV